MRNGFGATFAWHTQKRDNTLLSHIVKQKRQGHTIFRGPRRRDLMRCQASLGGNATALSSVHLRPVIVSPSSCAAMTWLTQTSWHTLKTTHASHSAWPDAPCGEQLIIHSGAPTKNSCLDRDTRAQTTHQTVIQHPGATNRTCSQKKRPPLLPQNALSKTTAGELVTSTTVVSTDRKRTTGCLA